MVSPRSPHGLCPAVRGGHLPLLAQICCLTLSPPAPVPSSARPAAGCGCRGCVGDGVNGWRLPTLPERVLSMMSAGLCWRGTPGVLWRRPPGAEGGRNVLRRRLSSHPPSGRYGKRVTSSPAVPSA